MIGNISIAAIGTILIFVVYLAFVIWLIQDEIKKERKWKMYK